ncbi:Chloramphenicol acetyltransferase [bioreactor metagenome]|uniref:Chloramphenicol acetyltransferase n=1 Tax=bioreactor metagenome TaxID=1076179 RepID=A0A644UU61_9ZZZZ
MLFNIIDLNTWKRKYYYQHYIHTVRCTYSITVNIEIDSLVKELKLRGVKAYPAQIYMLSCAVNKFQEFRMAINTHGELGYWESTSPSYTILNKKN